MGRQHNVSGGMVALRAERAVRGAADENATHIATVRVHKRLCLSEIPPHRIDCVSARKVWGSESLKRKGAWEGLRVGRETRTGGVNGAGGVARLTQADATGDGS